jgi:2-polyprenyl-6-methoxyphenol hydroxylase-like FAD-dependent oxidoreductase
MALDLSTDCCIAGGGPAGMMLGYILARAGLRVAVLEKHADFFRDFRGDTVHPSTMEAMSELGLLDRFLQRPHDEIAELSAQIGETVVKVGDFRHLPTKAKFIAMMPQWDFLDFLREEGRRYANLDVRMQVEAVDLMRSGGRVTGVRARGPDGPFDIAAKLVVAADGRTSVLREKAGLKCRDFGAPIDVLWMRLPRRLGDENLPLGRADAGHMLVMIPRGDYFQCAFVVPKGGYDAIRAKGLPAFRQQIADAAPMMSDRVAQLTTWDDIKLLTVTVDRLDRWWTPGLLCIGDAAHAMSPVGGVGINFAIADAVAAANILAGPLHGEEAPDAVLAAVQRRREGPVKLMQAIQIAVQNLVLAPLLKTDQPLKVPWPAKLLDRAPALRRIPARVVGLGFRMEHVRVAEAKDG